MLKKAKKIAVKQLESKNGGNIYCHKYANIGLDISCYTTNLFSKITIYTNFCLQIVVSEYVGHFYSQEYTHEYHFTHICPMYPKELHIRYPDPMQPQKFEEFQYTRPTK